MSLRGYEPYKCFQLPWIGVDGLCDNIKPTSGLMINSLPGITLRRLALTANEEDITGRRLFERVEKAAIDRVIADVIQEMGETYQFNGVLDSERFGVIGEEFSTDGKIRRGIRITKPYRDEFIRVKIEQIELKPDADVTTTVYIDDGSQDIQQTAFKLRANRRNRLDLDFETKEATVDIYFDSACANWADADAACTSQQDLCCGRFYGNSIVDCGDGWEFGSTWNGMRVKISTVCDSCEFISSHVRTLKLPGLFLMGTLIMQEVINSDRTNPYIRNSKEEAEALIVQWYGGLDRNQLITRSSGEYQKALKAAIAQMKVHAGNIDSDCVDCGGVQIVTNIL